jgi:pimeloyl-ACP methyl ester carboxylesterase
VTWSRPGYADATRQPGRRVVDVASDAAEVLAALNIAECLVLGWSGGGPHALACAARLSGVRAAATIASVAPYGAEGLDFLAGMGDDNIEEFSLALKGADSVTPFLESMTEELRGVDGAQLAVVMASILPPVDVDLMTDAYGQEVADNMHEGLKHGCEGWLDDDLAFTADWGFSLGEIVVPVSLWQGGVDLMVPYAHGVWLSNHVPGARAHLYAGEGHLSIGVGKLDAIVDDLIAAGA